MATSHRILLTGANGYTAQHILWELLEAGHSVRATARSQSKIDLIKKSFSKYADTPKLDFGVVPDITVPKAFDEVLKSTPPFDTVVHTASPFFLTSTDPTVYLEPAIKGTTEILENIVRVAPTVKRVVILSSFAAVATLHENPISDPPKVYKRDDWLATTLEEAKLATNPVVSYPASKKLAEEAAWNFVKEGKGNFELVTLVPGVILGPVFDPKQIEDPETLNFSTWQIYNMLLKPGVKSSDPVPPTSIWQYVDVRDLARAHLLAVTKPEAAGKRWITVGGEMSHQEWANYLREALPEKSDVIPIGEPANIAKPEGWFTYSAPETVDVLGLTYRTRAETIKDLAPQLAEFAAKAAAAPAAA